ncbi:PREDICTED: uncharacterized protein LOC105458738, partial [Wasmannia auropunctata]|uniref:uncharacterized protein LOC105458738 n=1 Tax=Wasmannia auropunctata TaxID=64793 RepID=UPI0005F0654B
MAQQECFPNQLQGNNKTDMIASVKKLNSLNPFFDNEGVDYGGPFLIKDKKGKGCKTNKCYICLFICFATKAIHLELVSDLTTECFISALRRFVFRRGKPAHVYSDDGTNFVANCELNDLARFLLKEQTSLSECINDIGINWHFIPAYSPHFGGLWEAGIKSTKHHLKRVASNSSLTFEEFYTLITQIETILNSRPLTPMSTDPNDLISLTPAHFLIGKILNSMADLDLTHLPGCPDGSWSRICSSIFERDGARYLSELQQHTKWKRPFPQLKEDTM